MASSKWKVGLPSKIHSLTWKVIYFRLCLWILHIWVVHFVPSSLQQHSNIISDKEREFEIHVHFLELAFKPAPILAQIWPSMPSVKRWQISSHVGRQRKGSAALKMGLLPAYFALAWVSPSFGLIPHWKWAVSIEMECWSVVIQWENSVALPLRCWDGSCGRGGHCLSTWVSIYIC